MEDPNQTISSCIPPSNEEHAKHYRDEDFWAKVRTLPRDVVGQVLEKALLLRELLFAPGTPLWIRGTIISTILYLISPVDACPDFLPGVGYLDDIALLGLVVANLDGMITEDIRQRVRRQLGSDPATTAREEDAEPLPNP